MSFIVRTATPADIPDLLALEDKCWDGHLKANEEIIAKRIEIYPEGNKVFGQTLLVKSSY